MGWLARDPPGATMALQVDFVRMTRTYRHERNVAADFSPSQRNGLKPVPTSIFSTREGLVGGTTAKGHVIVPNDRFALPSRRALSTARVTIVTLEIRAFWRMLLPV